MTYLQPGASFDFLSGSLDPRINISRALNTATRVNSSGIIEIVNADLPRFDYNLTTLAPQGLLIESASTNLLLNSNFAGGVSGSPGTAPTSWLNFLTGSATTTYGADPQFPSGNAVRVQVPIGSRFQFSQTVSVSPGVYTWSIQADIALTVSLNTQIAIIGPPAGTTFLYYVDGILYANPNIAPPTGTHKLEIVITAINSGNIQLRFGGGIQAGLTLPADITFSRPQMELNNRRSSYIPTAGTTVTRNADVATITGADFTSFWQAAKGGATVQALPSTVSGIRPLIQFDDGTADNLITLRGNGTDPELYIVDATTPQAQIDAGTIAANVPYALTGWWEPNFCAARLDSNARVIDTSATIPTVTQARIGSDGTNYLNGHLATISYYDRLYGQIYNRRKNKVVFSVI